MAARQLVGRRPLYSAADVSLSLFSPSNLGGCLADRHQPLPYVRRWPRFTNVGLCQRFEACRSKASNFQRHFGQLRDLIVNIHAVSVTRYRKWNKKLSYRRETARQRPTWRGLSPSVSLPLPPLATRMHTVESETRNKRTLSWIEHSRSLKVILICADRNPERCIVVMSN